MKSNMSVAGLVGYKGCPPYHAQSTGNSLTASAQAKCGHKTAASKHHIAGACARKTKNLRLLRLDGTRNAHGNLNREQVVRRLVPVFQPVGA